MKVLLIRHAIAEDRADFARTGAPDSKRPLTDKGRDAMRKAARGLSEIVKRIDVLAASPLTRAQQTADVVAQQFPDARRETTDAMMPAADLPDFLKWLDTMRGQKCVAAVGHNDHISELAGWLIGAGPNAISMKKGAVLLLEIDDSNAGGGAARLGWYLTPKQLRKLGREGNGPS